MSRKRRRKSFNWFFVLMTFVVIYFSSVLITQQINLSKVDQSQDSYNKRLDLATKENEKLKKQIEELHDLDHIERIAREELGMTKPGELPYNMPKRSSE